MADSAYSLSDTPMAVFRINLALQGPVIDILGQFLPELNVLPREQAYDRVLDDLDLLHRCFKVFRRERDRFRSVLVDHRRRPVTQDNVPLSCGRSLAEVVAMILRTAAKRYFRRTVPPPVRPHDAGLPDHRTNPGDDLYDAIKAYLLHEWQVPLVPAYAKLDPKQVRQAGARILEARDPESLDRLIASVTLSSTADERPPPLPAAIPADLMLGRENPRTARLDEILTPNNQRLRAEAFKTVLLDPEVRAALPNADNIRAIAEILGGVGGTPIITLVEGLGLRKDQLAVMLLVAQDCIGTTVFGRLFGPRADPELVSRIVDRARLHGLGPESTIIDCAIFMRGLFARFGHRSRHSP